MKYVRVKKDLIREKIKVSDRRKHIRIPTYIDAVIITKHFSFPVIIIDVSLEGLGIKSPRCRFLKVNTPLEIKFKIYNKMAILEGYVTWVKGQRARVKIDNSSSNINLFRVFVRELIRKKANK